jgi:hypothetical protein
MAAASLHHRAQATQTRQYVVAVHVGGPSPCDVVFALSTFDCGGQHTSYAREARGEAFAHLRIPHLELGRYVHAHSVAGTVDGKVTSQR